MNKNYPQKKAVITSSDGPIPAQHTIDLSSTVEEVERPDLAVVTDETLDSPILKEYADELAFMEDILTIVVAKSEDKNAPNPVTCAVNGETRFLERGKQYRLQRKFVDALIVTSYRPETIQFKDKLGLDQTKIENVPVLINNISILHDPAGELGNRWFLYKQANS